MKTILNDIHGCKVKQMEKIFHENTTCKKVWVVMAISDKVDFRAGGKISKIKKKKGSYITKKGPIN